MRSTQNDAYDGWGMYVTVKVVTGKPWLLCLGNGVRLLLMEQDL